MKKFPTIVYATRKDLKEHGSMKHQSYQLLATVLSVVSRARAFQLDPYIHYTVSRKVWFTAFLVRTMLVRNQQVLLETTTGKHLT